LFHIGQIGDVDIRVILAIQWGVSLAQYYVIVAFSWPHNPKYSSQWTNPTSGMYFTTHAGSQNKIGSAMSLTQHRALNEAISQNSSGTCLV